MNKRFALLCALSALVGGVLFFGFTRFICEPTPLGTSAWSQKEKVAPGYTLVSPYYSDTNFEGSGEVHLIDTDGKRVHTWETKHPTLVSYLQPNGNLFAAMTPPLNIADYPSGGSTGIIQELDWEGNVLWEYQDSQMTHDFEVMPDGGIVYIKWHLSKPSFAEKVRGGMRTATTSVWTNELVRVDREKNIIWTWKPDDHLDPTKYVLSPLIPRFDWAHINSVRYIENNPVTHTPAYLISARDISTVFLIDEKTGSVIWETTGGYLSLQHDATLTDKGTILIFDNGLFRNVPRPALLSGLGEVDPVTNKVVWIYTGGPSVLEKAQFASSIMSGAQRLPNGNTLITLSMMNTLLEVTPDGDIVWKYTDDFRDKQNRMRVMFKVRKYDPVGTQWGKNISQLNTPLSSMCRAR